MSKQYGVTCDRCKNKIESPGYHCIVKISQFLSRDTTVKYDLCLTCQRLLEDFIGKYLEKEKIA